MSARLKVHASSMPSITAVGYEHQIAAWERELQEIEEKHGRIVSVISRPGKPYEFYVLTRGEDNGGGD